MASEGAVKNHDLLVAELLKRLPAQDDDWPLEERLRWFRAMISAIDLAYARPDEDRELRLEVRSRLPPARND